MQWSGGCEKGNNNYNIFFVEVLLEPDLSLPQTEQGKISLEGVVCEDYYKVRQLLFDQFAIV